MSRVFFRPRHEYKPYRRTARGMDLDHHYFESVSTREKAYILGLLAADGCVYRRWIKLTLHRRDVGLLEFVRDAVSPTAKIYFQRNVGILQLSSKPMVEDLGRLGIVPKKSCGYLWPPIDRFQREYLLGYFDGDGCWGIYSRMARWSLVGGKEFLERVKVFISDQCGIIVNGPYPKKNNKAWYLSVHCRKARNIDAWLNASGLGLKRKHASPSDPRVRDYKFRVGSDAGYRIRKGLN